MRGEHARNGLRGPFGAAMKTSFDDLGGFRAAVLAAVLDAAQGQARQLVMVDPDFADWPLDEPALTEALSVFARRPGRELQLLAADYERVRRSCPRFTRWRTLFGHAVDARLATDEQAELPGVVVVDGCRAVRLDDRRHGRGCTFDDPPEVHALRQSIDALLQRASPGFAATTLGL